MYKWRSTLIYYCFTTSIQNTSYMINQYQFEEFISNRETHQEYYLLMEEYANTELYKEIIHFMYLAFPKWNTNKGIGNLAAEFVLDTIYNFEYLIDETEKISAENLKNIYLSLGNNYKIFKSTFDISQITGIIDVFEQEYESELEEIDFDQNNSVWKILFENFKKEYLLQTTYNFINEDNLVIA